MNSKTAKLIRKAARGYPKGIQSFKRQWYAADRAKRTRMRRALKAVVQIRRKMETV